MSSVYVRDEQQDHEDLLLVVHLRLAREGESKGHDVVSFEIGAATGEVIDELGPIQLPRDRESVEYESALLNITDEVIRAIDRAEAAIRSAPRAALEDPNTCRRG